MPDYIQQALYYLGAYINDYDNDNIAAWDLLKDAKKELERFDKIETDANVGVKKKILDPMTALSPLKD